MVDLTGLSKGTIGLVVFVVILAIGAVLLTTLSNVTSLGATASNIITNGTALLSTLITSYGGLVLIAMVMVFILIPLLFILMNLIGGNGGRGRR